MKPKVPLTLDVTHTTLAVIFIGILIASSFWVLRPFLMPILWASLIVIATWPALEKLQMRLKGRRGLAVTIMTLAILLVVLIPLTLAVLTIIDHAGDIAARVKSLAKTELSSPPVWLEGIPFAGEKLVEKWEELATLSPEERSEMITPYAKNILQWFIDQAGSIGMTLVQFLLTTIIAAIMYAKGETIRSGVLKFACRLAGPQGEAVAVLAGKAVRGVALGVVVTAIVQASLGGIGLAITGVPAAALLTAVMLMLCLAQVGPALVLVPSVIWLYWKGSPVSGTVLLVFSVLAITLDNFIRPVLIKKGADLPLIMIFAGVIGGLIAFGIVGLFIGPVVLAVTYTLLKAWVTGSVQEEGACSSGAVNAPPKDEA
jgi:predicted PurR-regulated permease PerM